MREFVLNRNYTLRSLVGQSVRFIKNKPVAVPKILEREACAIGAELVGGGEKPNVLDDEKVPIELLPDERLEKIREAFATIVERNDSDDFTAAAVPRVPAVEKITEFDVDVKELNDAWKQFKIEMNSTEE